jgi:SAM-dependent methyltransferase
VRRLDQVRLSGPFTISGIASRESTCLKTALIRVVAVRHDLAAIDVANMRGLEIGPLAQPRVRKDEGPIWYVDHASAADLRQKYSIDEAMQELGLIDQIVETDYIVEDGKKISGVVAGDAPFDYVIASHLIEHIPDPVGWIAEVAKVLRPGGILSLVIPDKRYCFDINRRTSDISDIVDAYLRELTRPTFKQVYDFFSKGLFGAVDTAAVWAGTVDYSDVAPTDHEDPDVAALEACRSMDGSNAFVDAHCHVFTPDSFLELFEKLVRLRLIDFELVTFVPTEVNTLEFYVSLRLLDPAEGDIAARQQRQLASIEAVRPTAPVETAVTQQDVATTGLFEVSEREQKLLLLKRRILFAIRNAKSRRP